MIELKALLITGLVLLFLLLVLQVRLRLLLVYEAGGALLRLGLGSFRVTVYPVPTKRTNRRRKQKAVKEKKQQEEGGVQPKKGMELPLVQELIELWLDTRQGFKDRLRIDELILLLNWGLEDPADAAISYGYANAVMGGLLALLEENFKVKKRRDEIRLDYTLDKPNVYMKAACSLTMWQGLSFGLHAGRRVFAIYRRQKKQTITKETIKQ